MIPVMPNNLARAPACRKMIRRMREIADFTG